MKRLLIIILSLTVLLSSVACKKTDEVTNIIVKGSDTMVNLGANWAEEYIKKFPHHRVSITGGGSGIGITALIDGNTHIAQSSREIRPLELEKAKEKGVEPLATIVAYDGVAIAVNPKNPISSIDMETLSLIYQGKITSWKTLGWEDKEIVVISRDAASGTHFFFLEHIVQRSNKNDTWGDKTIFIPNTSTIVEEVSRNPYAIGYIGLGYVKPSIKVLKVVSQIEEGGILPSIVTIKNNTYPISRPLYFYTNGSPTGAVKSFIDFVLSSDGQVIVKENGFVPIDD